MKRLYLLLLGFIPLALGYLLNLWLTRNQQYVPSFSLIGIVFLALWVFIGFTTCGFGRTLLESSIIANLPALFMLIFIIFQSVILGYFWTNIFGAVPQLYYLPLINIATYLYLPFIQAHIWLSCLIGFLLMLLSYYLGGYIKYHVKGMKNG